MPGHGRVAAHAAGVRALVAVEDALVVLRRARAAPRARRRRARAATAPRPPGTPPARPRSRRSASRRRRRRPPRAPRARPAAMITPLPAASTSAFSTAGIGRAREVRDRLLAVAEHHVRRRSARRSRASAPWRRPSSPRSARPRCVGPNAAMPAALSVVHQARHERRLGAHDHEVDLALAGGRRPTSPRRAGTPRRRGRCRRCRAWRAPPARCGLRRSVRTSACSRPPAADYEDRV